MPSASPVPRGPSFLLLGSGAGLFTKPGCPACRYLAESGDAYLAWFALEGHAGPEMLHRLGASRGMCARHTRRLLAQPGAAGRLTAVYRHVVPAAVRDLSARPAACPACGQETAAEDRVLSAALDEFTAETMGQYQQHGGLCLPHLCRAARRGGGRSLRWLAGFMIARLLAPAPDLSLLSGWLDPDASFRAFYRAKLPPHSPAGVCRVCWAAADTERVGLAGAGWLCGPHLRDAAPDEQMLAWHAARHAQRLTRALDGWLRLPGLRSGWLSPRARRVLAEPRCAVCLAAEQAAGREIGAGPPLCVRHASLLHARDARAGHLAAGALEHDARQLGRELDAAFEAGTWLSRREGADAGAGPDTRAWVRAAVFLDGSVTGGCAAEAA